MIEPWPDRCAWFESPLREADLPATKEGLHTLARVVGVDEGGTKAQLRARLVGAPFRWWLPVCMGGVQHPTACYCEEFVGKPAVTVGNLREEVRLLAAENSSLRAEVRRLERVYKLSHRWQNQPGRLAERLERCERSRRAAWLEVGRLTRLLEQHGISGDSEMPSEE